MVRTDRPAEAAPSDQPVQPGSSSLNQPDYWWYRARSELLETVLADYLGDAATVLDVGSADGPSVAWMASGRKRITLDLFPKGLRPGEGVCGSATALPFADGSFDVASAFDVVEHCDDDRRAVSELGRVLRPGGRLLLSVPAYQWAWSHHDVRAGHYRRYTRPRLVALVEDAGLHVERATYAFGGVFPFFVAERTVRRVGQRLGRKPPEGLAPVSPRLEKVFLGLSRAERRALTSRNVPFGSSIFLAATKPG
ncbi:MAG: class I SAM-dependent methyltransferase [Nocardioidaceae bacterium]|nr:class I SAM-dependent methyltransferase [Nocardioidaceae bacterium]NUS51610.1 class I SAM-dependent methyltransferase [Nocardioidaceae bacterium]